MRRVFYISTDWIFLFAYLAAIFTVLPFTGYVLQKLIERGPYFSVIVSLLVYASIGIAAIALAGYVIISDKGYKIYRLLALALILYVGLDGLAYIETPRDKLHIIEYSILAFLLFRVLRFYNPTTALYLWCAVFVGIAGFADEFVQGFIPGRTFSLLDLKTDVCTGILSELAIMLVICPKLEKWRLKMSFYKKKIHEEEEWVKNYRTRRRE